MNRLTQIKTEIINSWLEITTLKDEWNNLLRRSNADTIFLTWEWIQSWAKIVGESVKPVVVCARDKDGTLIGIAPFYLTTYRLLRVIKYRVLRIMSDYATGFEYPDWITQKDNEADICQSIAVTLLNINNYWDCIWMPSAAGWTGTREKIIGACRKNGFYCHVRPRAFSAFELPKDMAIYMKLLSANRRSQLSRQMRKVFKRKGVTVSWCKTVDELPRYLEALFNLNHRRWKIKGEEGTFRRKPAEALFYKKFTEKALENGWLRLIGLEEQGEFKAIQIGYVYNNVFHQLQEGFDPDYMPGVGNVLRAKVIEACINEGVKAYDFLGDMTEHKRRWGAKQRTGYDLFIGHKSLKNRLLFAKEIWPTGRFLRQT